MNLRNSIRNLVKPKKPHLLIAGVDLKFIKQSIRYLEKYYEIRIDEWDWNPNEVSKESKDLLKWADIILCEWMEYYTPWYSNNVSKKQKLFIRAHKYEITLDYGKQINYDNVCGVITINYFLLEIFSNVFKIPREKMFFLNNMVETSIYENIKNPDYRKHIALVGYAPSYKGYQRALEILNQLKDIDNFKLYLFGKDFTQMHWKNDENEIAYFKNCDEYTSSHGLNDIIVKKNWVERHGMFSDIGYVLSLSDLEGSHLSPTEAFADSTVSLLLKWPGIEYIYPEEIIFNDITDIVTFIKDTYNTDDYMKIASKLKDYCIREFGEDYFVNGLRDIFSNKSNVSSKTYTSFKNAEFENSFIADDEDEIADIIKSNTSRKIQIILSENFKNHEIKNIYSKYASQNVLIYSKYFYENIGDAEKFIELCNRYHGSNIILH